MAGKGGARPNSGPEKGYHRIAAGELRKELEASLGIPYTRMLAMAQLKLFNDFQVGENTKEFITFTENMSKRILQDQTHEVNVNSTADLTPQEIQDRINNLLTRQTLSSPKAPDAEVQETN